ncbi:MAG: peptidoglycan DD-metalloendopeptidase family protein [Gammaproteobacteria bacterium]
MDYRPLIDQQIKPQAPQWKVLRRQSGKIRWWLPVVGVVLVGGLVLSTSHDLAAPHHARPAAASTPAARAIRALPLPAAVPQSVVTSAALSARVQTPSTVVRVRPGDNLAAIFQRVGVSPQQLHAILSLGPDTAALRRIYPGHTLKFVLDGPRLQSLEYVFNPTRSLLVRRGPAGYTAQMMEQKPEVRVAHATGVIRDSLFVAGQKAGLSDNLIMELAHIFGWDVDFALDIRDGDHFAVVYEQRYLKGRRLSDGEILAAEFVNRGRVYRAVRYTDARRRTDYFAPDGRNMRKAFIRTPVSFTRISSRFSLHRSHPILHRTRRHVGVDYAAPVGTPIHATGAGKVVLASRKNGYGRTVILQHGHGYSTLYAHLSRFARGLRSGARIRQGQVIGYVGMSGLATGPHLHYEFRIHGVHHDPLNVRLPDAQPINARYRADFQAKARPLLAQLAVLERTQVALGD